MQSIVKVSKQKGIKIKDISISKDKLFLFFQYIFAFSLILNTRSVYVHTPAMDWMNNFVVLLMAFAVAGCVLTKNKFSRERTTWTLMIAVGVFLYLLLFYVVDPYKDSVFLKIIMEVMVLLLYCFLVEDRMQDTMRKFSNIVVMIAGISLFFWIFGSLLDWIPSTGTWILDWGSASGDAKGNIQVYYGIYFETQTIYLSGIGRIIRNTAIFTEAPMCSLVFSLAFLVEIYLRKKKRILVCVILVLGIISTTSTTGIAIVVLALGIKIMLKRGLRPSKSWFSMIAKSVLIPLLCLLVALIVFYFLSTKLNSSASASGASRLYDFVNGFRAWFGKPIFGYGYGTSALVLEYGNYGFSNSIIPILTQGGLYLFLLYLFPIFWGVTICILGKDWNKLIFYLLFLVMFVITIIPFQNLTFYFLLTMVATRGKVSE